MPLLLILIAVELGILIHLYRINHPKYKERTKSIGVHWSTQKGDSKMADLSLNVGQSSTGTIVPQKADGTPTVGATLASATWTVSDPAITVTNNNDFTLTVTGVSATTSPISGTVSATGTDGDGTPWSFSTTFTITVGGGAVTERTTGIGVAWSNPA